MGFNCGIVGLPNVGKSTLFNALTATESAEAANYPFCTIEPNKGKIGVPDSRLEIAAKIAGSKKIIPTQLEIVDIAGLVRGAHKGEGLGNQFLGHIRSVDAIIHVLRCFEDDDITHVEGGVDPLRDIAIIETELMLADMDSMERRLATLEKKAKGDVKLKAEIPLVQKTLSHLQQGFMAKTLPLEKEDIPFFNQLSLITTKPILYVCNVSENDASKGNGFTQQVQEYAISHQARSVIISAAIEAEVSHFSSLQEQIDFLSSLGLKETGLKQVVKEGYHLLDLLTFFTCGPQEARAWTTVKGAKAPQAAGEIHTDFEKGFICAETISYEDYVLHNGENGAKTAGKMRLEGRDYLVKEGDIFHFRFNV